MRTFYRLAMAGAAAVLVAGAAQAQNTITLTDSGGGDIVAGVNVSTTANLASLSGSFAFTVTPSDIDFGTSGTGIDGIITVTLQNGSVLGTPTITAAAATTCLAAVNAATLTVAGDGKSFSFRVPDIANCGGGAEGVPEITASIGVSSLAAGSANFTVGVTRIDSVVLAATKAFDTVGDGTGFPLVQINAPWTARFVADAVDDHGLALGQTPPFSAFDAAGTDFDSVLGTFEVKAVGTALNLQNTTTTGTAEAVALSITAGNATGIDRIEVGLGGAFATLAPAAAGSNVFTTADKTAVAPTGALPVTLFLNSDADPATAASVAAQSFSPAATVAESTGFGVGVAAAEFNSTGSLASLTRDGLTRTFEWVALENAFINNQFRFTGLAPTTDVFVTVFDLNTGETPASDIPLKSHLTVSAGGEASLTGKALGTILQGLGELDTTLPGVTRGTVSISIEADNVEVRRQLVSIDGGVSIDTDLSN